MWTARRRCSAPSRQTATAIEPAHWVAEVAGVVARLKPDRAGATMRR
jgi:hypothetical protein